jgi:3-deoxy-7-phosphoheptulonate synthase
MLNAKLAIASHAEHNSIVKLSEQVAFGGKELVIIGGPCTVESRTQMEIVATQLQRAPVQALRGGVFKPRTSPYAFQGMGLEGLEILLEVRKRHNIPVVTEVMSIGQIESIVAHADMLQVGSRNMQNFDLLKALGEVDKPILLKRGLAATIEEFVMAAEYIMSHGNSQVVLCERGIRSFDNYTRNVLDLGAVVALKQVTHLPVIVDPSHAVGKRELVAPLAKAADRLWGRWTDYRVSSGTGKISFRCTSGAFFRRHGGFGSQFTASGGSSWAADFSTSETSPTCCCVLSQHDTNRGMAVSYPNYVFLLKQDLKPKVRQ